MGILNVRLSANPPGHMVNIEHENNKLSHTKDL